MSCLSADLARAARFRVAGLGAQRELCPLAREGHAKLGALYLQNAMWDGEELLPHVGRLRADRAPYQAHLRGVLPHEHRPAFPHLPPDAAWASGASDQRIFILRRHCLTVAVSNETDYPMDLPALNRLIAAAIAAWA